MHGISGANISMSSIISRKQWCTIQIVKAALLLPLCALLTQTLPAAALEKGWIFEQQSMILGPHTVYLSERAFKAVNKRSGIIVIAKAPEWRVTVASNRSFKYFEMPAGEFRGELSGKVFAGHQEDLANSKWQVAGSAKIKGLDALEYHMQKVHKEAARPSLFNQRLEFAHFDGVNEASLYVLKVRPLKPTLAHIVCELYDLPRFPQFPLRLFTTDKRGVETKTIDTVSARFLP